MRAAFLLIGALSFASLARGELALGFYTWAGDEIPRALDAEVFPYLIPYGIDGLYKKGGVPAYLRKQSDFKILFSLKDAFRDSRWYADPPGCSSHKEDARVIACLVEKLDTLPGIAGWYLADEPTHTMKRGRFQRIFAASREVAKISSKPIFVEDIPRSESWESLARSADVLMTSSYPVPRGDYLEAYHIFRNLREKIRGKKVWAVIQAFDPGDYKNRMAYHRPPTLAELRILSHLAVAAGVDGIIYFSLRDISKNGEEFLAGPMRDLGKELQEFYRRVRAEKPEIVVQEEEKLVRGLKQGRVSFVINASRENRPYPRPPGKTQGELAPLKIWKAGEIRH